MVYGPDQAAGAEQKFIDSLTIDGIELSGLGHDRFTHTGPFQFVQEIAGRVAHAVGVLFESAEPTVTDLELTQPPQE